MFSKYLFCLPALLLAACNSQPTASQPETTATAPPPVAASVTSCYQSVSGKDTVTLRTITQNGVVTGTLAYSLFEKDKNRGTIQGQVQNGQLLADYTFASEGMESVRQVAFKQQDGTWVEGYGEVTDQQGKMVFKNPAALDYGHSRALKPVPCPE